MSTTLTYALALTICSAVMNLLLYFTGLQTERLNIGQHLQWLGLIFTIVVLWLGIKAVREERGAQGLSYGRALWTGVVISFFSGLMSAVYTYIHFAFINTSFVEYNLELARSKWAAAGMSDAQMEQAATFARKFMSPGFMAAMTPFFAVFLGLLVSLVLAAILKKPAADSAVAAPPAA